MKVMDTRGPTDVILRNVSTLRLRAQLGADVGALFEFFGHLSDRSRFLRFHGFPPLGPALIQPMVDPDWTERGALVGELDGEIVAIANYVRLRDRRVAEAAVTVLDDVQGRGIGTLLLERLADAAAAAAGIGSLGNARGVLYGESGTQIHVRALSCAQGG
jgi:GNAT superfamily N-acetyltransferase